MNKNSLNEQNHLKWEDISKKHISYKKGGMACHCPTHLGQSNQDSKKSLKKCRITRGRSPSKSLGALNVNPNRGLRTIKHFLAVPQTLATMGSDKSPQNPSHRMTPSKSLIFENLPPAGKTSIILKDFPSTKSSPL